MVELDIEPPDTRLDNNKNFIENFQTAILLSLLDKGALTKLQFDLCVDKLQKQIRG